MIKVLTVVGARPQFIKAAPLSRALQASEQCREIILHSGQHYDKSMSKVFFDDLGLPKPNYNLSISGGTHGEMTGRMLREIEAISLSERPTCVLVYGDTNTTLAGALAAAKLNIPVVHVEAGLRSFNRRMPEETNRVIVDHISTLLACPTAASTENLRAEGITQNVYHVGDVMYDAAMMTHDVICSRPLPKGLFPVETDRYALCTVHRAENTDTPENLTRIIQYLQSVSDLAILLPIHPRTRKAIETWGLTTDGIRLIEPLGYFDFQALLQGAAMVLTDSGGLQKEAYFHRIPCVTLRAETEWEETIQAGWNRLWTVADYRPRKTISDYGDGRAAQKIVALIERLFS